MAGAREYTTSPFVTSTLPELAYDEEGFIERGVRACSDIIGGSDTVREDCSLWLAEGWRTLTEEQRDQPSDEWEDLMGSPGTLASHLGSPSSIEGVRFLALLEEYDRRYSELLEIPGFRIWEEDEGSDSSLEFVNSPVYNRRKRKVKFAKENFRSEFDELRSNYIAGGWPVNEPEVEYSRRSSGCNVQ